MDYFFLNGGSMFVDFVNIFIYVKMN